MKKEGIFFRFFYDMRRYYRYAMRLARASLRAEVANAYLNWLWWLIEPFSMMLIYGFIFGIVFQSKEEYFNAFLFIGLTIWRFFSRSVVDSSKIIRGNRAIISKVYMPKYILVFSELLVNAFKMLLSFGVVIIMIIIYKVHITINVLFIIPIMMDLFLVTFSVSVILMHYGVLVRDLSYIVNIVLQMLMYLTGTFYSIINRVPAPYGEIMEKANPIAYFIASARNVLLYGHTVSVKILLGWALLSCFILSIGISLVYRHENSYVKVI